MSEVFKVIFIIAVMVVVAGFVGYKIYLNWKKQSSEEKSSILTVIQFVFSNMDYFVDTLQNVMYSLGDINPADFETDDKYRTKLIEEAVHIIETKAAEVGISFSLNHDTLVNFADIIIKEVLRRAEVSKKEALATEKADAKIEGDKSDITLEIEKFYE